MRSEAGNMARDATLLPPDWALVVVDMQNDFLDACGYYARRAALERRAEWDQLSAEGQARLLGEAAPAASLGPRGVEVERLTDNVNAAIRAARAAGRPLAVVRAAYDRSFEVQPPLLLNNPMRQHWPCRPGSWGAGLVAPVAAALAAGAGPAEREFEKHTYDAFTNPALADFLRAAGTGAVVVCGTETQVCVMATAQHATFLGFRVVILADATWSADAAGAAAALKIFRDAYGATLDVGALKR